MWVEQVDDRAPNEVSGPGLRVVFERHGGGGAQAPQAEAYEDDAPGHPKPVHCVVGQRRQHRNTESDDRGVGQQRPHRHPPPGAEATLQADVMTTA